MTFQEDDNYESSKAYRYAFRSDDVAPDGLPFSISICFMEDGRIHHFWGVRFSSRQSAEEAARALVSMSFCKTVWVHEDVAVYKPWPPPVSAHAGVGAT